MTDVRTAFPECLEVDSRWFSPPAYESLVDTFGFETKLWVEDDDYQGDSYILLRDGDRWGYLNFGWGSCSGCDSLQGCGSFEELEELQKDLFGSIRWDSREGLA